MPDMTAEEKLARETAARADLNAEAERVMNSSKPTPSQAEVDAVKTGKRTVDDKENPDNPEMPPLVEQQARIAEAGGERSLYRTRQARADRFSDERYPQHRELARAMDENAPAASSTPEPQAAPATSAPRALEPKKP